MLRARTLAEGPNREHYKNLKIFPTRSDILGNDHVKIEPNIIDGAYPSTEHYIDLQFKLLREDCFRPLREGIGQYMENPSKKRHENIKVYPQVRVLRTYISNNKVGHLIDLAWNDRRSGIDPQAFANKQLMYGSLLLFTNDHFETILCATVLDSNPSLSKKGHLAVSFQNPISKKIFSTPYLMVESEVFFEPYHQVLKVLQNMSTDQLPMKKYIVDIQTDPSPPAYLKSCYKRILPLNQLPEFKELDESQFRAFIFALTREFAVIQGPPGTGKTFIGVKIASTILKKLAHQGTPMLIICYTNHALDQFLEGILKVTDSIVRIGSQSKSKILEPYNLSSVKAKIKYKGRNSYAKKRAELRLVYNEMADLHTKVADESKRSHLKISCGDNYELAYSSEDPVIDKMTILLERYNKINSELEELSRISEGEILRGRLVVGMTTTAAARRHRLMNELRSTVVIVEEAAEVLEAHIVASLTHHCQHLILIGDHKQLRPSAAHYQLARACNLEVSLFERMVRNGLHARTLTTQRRMRPNIAQLLVPTVYDTLDSHPTVFKYKNVRGINKNLFFYSHDVFEDSEGLEESSSHKNVYEAKWCVSLANYFRKKQYKPDEITILSTYLAQVELIKKLSKKYELLREVKVTSVDNFQGEESRIVILSLVRSNRERKIGFLATENRICVALSRAKEGFYIFGNMNILKSSSPIWRAINDKLEAQNAIGNIFTVHCCEAHRTEVLVKSPKELDSITFYHHGVALLIATIFNFVYNILRYFFFI